MSGLYRVTLEAQRTTQEPEPDLIPFSAGNPSVEHVTGILHLYRPQEASILGQPGSPVRIPVSVYRCLRDVLNIAPWG